VLLSRYLYEKNEEEGRGERKGREVVPSSAWGVPFTVPQLETSRGKGGKPWGEKGGTNFFSSQGLTVHTGGVGAKKGGNRLDHLSNTGKTLCDLKRR